MSQSGISFSPLFLSFSFLFFFSPFFTRDRFHQKNTRRVKTVVLPSRSAGRSSTTPRRIRTSIRLENIYIYFPPSPSRYELPRIAATTQDKAKKKKKKKKRRERRREIEIEREGARARATDRQTDRQPITRSIKGPYLLIIRFRFSSRTLFTLHGSGISLFFEKPDLLPAPFFPPRWISYSKRSPVRMRPASLFVNQDASCLLLQQQQQQQRLPLSRQHLLDGAAAGRYSSSYRPPSPPPLVTWNVTDYFFFV